MKETGQSNRLKKKWMQEFRQDCQDSDKTRPLKIGDVFVAFVMLLVATGITLIILQLEKIHVSLPGLEVTA